MSLDRMVVVLILDIKS